MDFAARITNFLLGQNLVKIERFEHEWRFCFANNMYLQVECPWRVIAGGRIAYGDEDHAQQFGLPAPLDGLDRTNTLLLNKTVQGVQVRDETGDLTISFDNQRALEILNLSCGYEAWHFTDGADLFIVAQGGGQLSSPTIIRG